MGKDQHEKPRRKVNTTFTSNKEPPKFKKPIGKSGKYRDKSAAILKVDTKVIKNKERRKDLVQRQKLETRKLRKLQKLKEKRVRAEHGEAVSAGERLHKE